MKKYAVVRNSCLVPNVVFQTEVLDDAVKYAEIMNRNEQTDERNRYIVFEMVEG